MSALLNKGFRIFFLGAALYALLSMGLWSAIWPGWYQPSLTAITTSQWHAHEMIYGYTLAVIAGYLLTAIPNWTGIMTIRHAPLAAVFGLWVIARLAFTAGTRFIVVAAIADMLFVLALTVACGHPLIKARQWKQMAILSKLVLLGIGNALFYAGAFGLSEHGLHWSLYGAFYIVIALILTMMRRVIPSFTENAFKLQTKLRNALWLDMSSLVLLLLFWICEVFLNDIQVAKTMAAIASLLMFLINMRRLMFWYVPGIWRRPLLWSMHLAFALIATGFLLYALAVFGLLDPSLALHTFAIGGIALITLSMMARVSLGHTGRNVQEAPRAAVPMFILLLVAAVLRVLGPMLYPAAYMGWILSAQLAWIAAFATFGIAWLPMLFRARVDGKPG